MRDMAALCAGVLGFAATTIGHYAEAWVCGYFFSTLVPIFMLMAFNSED